MRVSKMAALYPETSRTNLLVSVAIPGLLLILIVGLVSEGAASFLAGSTDLPVELSLKLV